MMLENKEKLIQKLFEEGFLINKDLLDKDVPSSILDKIKLEEDLIVLNSDYADILNFSETIVNWYDLDASRVEAEKERNDDLYQTQLQQFKKIKVKVDNFEQKEDLSFSNLESNLSLPETDSSFSSQSNLIYANKESDNDLISFSSQESSSVLKVIFNTCVEILVKPQAKPKKYEVTDFIHLFVSRYKFLETILRKRRDLINVTTINRVLEKNDQSNLSIIGLVNEIKKTKNNNLIITLEDLTGKIDILCSKFKEELYSSAKDLVVDEIIGVSGCTKDKFIFAEKIIWPDVPNDHELKKSDKEEYVLFLSDLHVGSRFFLQENFLKFLKWIKQDLGNEEQKRISAQVKYIFIAGDLVDGIGIYPSQEQELDIKDIKEQYQAVVNLIKEIPSEIKIIICPGNHDATHLAEPQSIFYPDVVQELHQLKNVFLVPNPALINIAKTETFSGFNVLLYHGYSFDYYVSNVDSIRNKGGYHRSDLIMKFLLKRRHLAPSFTSTPYHPAYLEDPLLIKQIPDFFLTGHIHYSCVANYKGITLISSSCWQSKTSFQEKLGHEPEPARVPLVNLKTREVKIIKFI